MVQSGTIVVGGVGTVGILVEGLVGVLLNAVVLNGLVVIGGVVVKQEDDFVSTAQVALQNAIKHHLKPSVTL